MNYHKAILQYDGTDRHGFQHSDGALTIQGDLTQVLQTILTGDFTTRAASRTDKGVHAIAQVIKISAEDPRPLTAAQLNVALPAHIRCLEISPCPADFIPSIDQRTKEYNYLFTSNGIDQRFIANVNSTLNIDLMQNCVAMLTGTKDFKNFWSIGGVSNTTVREIHACELSEINPQDLLKGTLFTTTTTRCWQFRIHGTGFLKHMVRHLVGALWQVGSGKLSVDDFAKLLHGDLKPQRPWKKADPKGLFLVKVHYL
jgi:tRNA pseudouridine38-40 synthase